MSFPNRRNSSAARVRAGLGFVLAAAVWASASVWAPPLALASPEKIRNHFDSDAPLREPGFFDFATLGAPGEAQWKVVTEFNPPSAPNAVSQVLTERPAQSVGVALRRNVRLTDGVLTVGIKKLSGHAGLVFRMADENNFLALLVDPAAGDAKLLRWDKGRSFELAQGRVTADHDWGTLSVKLAGPKVTATWNGKALLEATNAPAVEGRVGIATAGPGLMTMDEFVIEPAGN